MLNQEHGSSFTIVKDLVKDSEINNLFPTPNFPVIIWAVNWKSINQNHFKKDMIYITIRVKKTLSNEEPISKMDYMSKFGFHFVENMISILNDGCNIDSGVFAWGKWLCFFGKDNIFGIL